MKHPFFFSFFALLIFASVLLSKEGGVPVSPVSQNTPRATCTLHLRGDIAVEMATTSEAHERGLSGHAPLLVGEGMLFRFATTGERSFWMKDMLFPLDIIWLDENLRVLSFFEHVRPDSFPATFTSPPDMRYALEVPAGTVGTSAIVSGDTATIDSSCGK